MRRLLGVLILGALAACDQTVDVGPIDGISVNVVAATAEQPVPGGGSIRVVHLDGLLLALGAIKLETAGVDQTVDAVFEKSDVVAVDLSGEPVSAQHVIDVPAGTYKEVEISIDKLEPGNEAEDLLIADHPDLRDASTAVSGRVVLEDGSEEAFTFTTALDRDMEIVLDPLFAVTDDDEPTGVRVTLTLRTSEWFKNAAGEWLDPRDPANRSVIEANIQASFEAFEDGDVDGEPGPVIR